MEKENKLPLSRITPTSLSRSAFSFLIDAAFTVALMLLLYWSIGVPGIINNNDYYPSLDAVTSLASSSKLFDVRGQGDFTYYFYSDKEDTAPADYAYKKYIDLMWNYFFDAVINNQDITANSAVTSSVSGAVLPGFEGTVDANSQEYGKWVYKNYFHYDEAASEHSFVPSVANDFTSKPIAGKDEKTYHLALRNELFDDIKTYKGYYFDAAMHLTTQPKFIELNRRISLAKFAGYIPSIVISPIVFFFILPLCLSHGKTLGKLFLSVAVIDFDGYSASRLQILIRQAVITFIWLLLALPWQTIAMPLFVLLLLIAFMSRIISKRSQALHDKIARTLSIYSKNSVWFASKEEEEEFMRHNPSSPVAKRLTADAKERKRQENSVSTSALIEAEERILDLSTINKRREEARNMTSFDEFEKKSDDEFTKREEEAAARQTEEAGEEPPDPEAEEKALADLAALEGLSPDEAKALAEESSPEEDDPDAFVDEKKE